MTKEQYLKLAQKIADGSASDEEIARYNASFEAFQQEATEPEADLDQLQAESFQRIQRELQPKVRPLWPRIAAAASILIACGVGGYFILHRPAGQAQQTAAIQIKPGSNGAILTLSNGHKIVLDQTKPGSIAQGIQKTGDSVLTYQDGQEVAYNTLETPRGKQYQIILPDGSKVWLNAASSLKYPTAFNGPDRTVELTGEAYFAVVHNSQQPFKVKTASQTIEDIGTEFNVNSYADEAESKTTLVEGAISVNGKTMRPGQQAITQNNSLAIKDVDTEEATAWKHGNFQFEHTDVQTAMRQLARWYDVQIKYEGNFEQVHYTGNVPRRSDISDVLKALKETGGTHFKIEGKTITVTP